ncbi:DUF421 domain-containing protein [Salegentibacter sediminis]|uniref:DUF421 domain-containing protein n=1 Tax=Salegentibacter sediminis TaxID=1930251 RepID=UPI0009BE1EC0|nr:YetF domain-containing protein [Salegentibacter sediminis]
MEKWFEFSTESLIAITLTAIGIYLAVIILTRIAGKRSFSKMSSFDFAMTVAIGSIIAGTTLNSSISLAQGITGLASVYFLQILIAILRRHTSLQKLIDNSPLLLMDGPEILNENLKKARLTQGDLRSKLREANVTKFSDIKAVVFETTGDISVLQHNDGDLEVESWLLKDVER